MGFRKVTAVLEALRNEDVPADHSYPAEIMPALDHTVAAVHLDHMTPEMTRVAVHIFAPKKGQFCEICAERVVAVLKELGAQYQVGNCTFDKHSGCFTCCVLGTWTTTTAASVLVDGKKVTYLTEVSVKRSVSRSRVWDPMEEEMAEDCKDMGWNITIREMLPADSLPGADMNDEFMLVIHRTGGYERYNKCRWVQISLESVANGMLRTRVARTWDDRSVFTNT